MATLHGNPEPIAIAVLAKAPLARAQLAPALGPEGAAAPAARFVERAVAIAKAAAIGPVALWVTPDPDHPAFEVISALLDVGLREQPEGNIGARMLAAIAASGGPSIVISTDCPALAPEHVRSAGEVLRDGVDAVVIPVEDDGYALIGMRRAEPALFTGTGWSTAATAQTRCRLARLGLTWREPARLRHVDVPADLERLDRTGLRSLMQ
jgi:glycosyltransferase A (GT-A) superfamily protein (DUF2064 family)